MEKIKVGFICIHNSCRSQIAEALGKLLTSDTFESYSAGTETKPQINQDAVRLMKDIYNIESLIKDKPSSLHCSVNHSAPARPGAAIKHLHFTL